MAKNVKNALLYRNTSDESFFGTIVDTVRGTDDYLVEIDVSGKQIELIVTGEQIRLFRIERE